MRRKLYFVMITGVEITLLGSAKATFTGDAARRNLRGPAAKNDRYSGEK